MSRSASRTRKATERGNSLLEFAISSTMLLLVIFSVVEVGRLVMVANAVANSARAGVRYASMHGSSRTGAGVNGPSGPTCSGATCQVVVMVQNFGAMGILDPSRLVITVSYPGTCADGTSSTNCLVNSNGLGIPAANDPGRLVVVTVKYPYDPLTRWIPWTVTIGSTAQGVIVL